MTGILDEYAVGVPSHQTAIDLFKGEWASRLPGPFSSGSHGFLSRSTYRDDQPGNRRF